MSEGVQFLADRGQGALRVDKFLTRRVKHVTRSRIQSGIAEGCVRINGEVITSCSQKVHGGDAVELTFPDSDNVAPDHLLPEEMSLDVVHEDEHVLVVNKQAGVVVHPAHRNWTGTLLNGLAHHLGYSPNGAPSAETENLYRLGLVHRLDKGTSGLLMVAKTAAAQTFLSKQLAERRVRRRYMALVWGVPQHHEGVLNKSLARDPKDRRKVLAMSDPTAGKHACTHYEVMENFGYVSLLACRLETGRTHQIRAHMKDFGHPIFGDEDYEGRRIHKGKVTSKYKKFIHNCFQLLPRQALHAESLGFQHPKTKKFCNFVSPLPEDFQQVLNKWERYARISE